MQDRIFNKDGDIQDKYCSITCIQKNRRTRLEIRGQKDNLYLQPGQTVSLTFKEWWEYRNSVTAYLELPYTPIELVIL